MVASEHSPGSAATQSKGFSSLVQTPEPLSRKGVCKGSDLGRLSVLRPFA